MPVLFKFCWYADDFPRILRKLTSKPSLANCECDHLVACSFLNMLEFQNVYNIKHFHISWDAPPRMPVTTRITFLVKDLYPPSCATARKLLGISQIYQSFCQFQGCKFFSEPKKNVNSKLWYLEKLKILYLELVGYLDFDLFRPLLFSPM